MVSGVRRASVIALALLATGLPGTARAQANWLNAEAPVAGWNVVGATLPQAVATRASNPNCGADARPVETPEDAALAAAGWTLYNGY